MVNILFLRFQQGNGDIRAVRRLTLPIFRKASVEIRL